MVNKKLFLDNKTNFMYLMVISGTNLDVIWNMLLSSPYTYVIDNFPSGAQVPSDAMQHPMSSLYSIRHYIFK